MKLVGTTGASGAATCASTHTYERCDPHDRAVPSLELRELGYRSRSAISPEERDKFLNGADVLVKAKDGREWAMRREPNPALQLYILCALHTGARRGELAALTWANVDMKARTVTFRHTKNGHARAVAMTETLPEALPALPRPLSPEARVLPERDPKVLSRAFARLVADLKLPNLRRTSNMNALPPRSPTGVRPLPLPSGPHRRTPEPQAQHGSGRPCHRIVAGPA